jgi:hypothetical protein
MMKNFIKHLPVITIALSPVAASFGDYDLSFSENEITLNQGESTQIGILMNTTDFWFGGEVSINTSIDSAPGLISSIDAALTIDGIPAGPTAFASSYQLGNATQLSYADLSGLGFAPGNYGMGTISLDASDIAVGQYQLDFNSSLTSFQDLLVQPLDQGNLSGTLINIVPAPGAIGLAFLGLTFSTRKRRKE